MTWTIEIGGHLLAAVVVAGLVLLVIHWWRFRSIAASAGRR